ncbi:RNA polymerase sigma factor [Eubacterium sp.]|uniref:RNA polymerase sigma factor n=1 Tax=Eubacterium sp. TaxID=142586 RepID=UPI0025D84F3B|nr:RNA polymerase sigma factor [Eubacterium sp.]MCR5629299.1 RNA polymerase sigma factor [Eubacterium sp.]
MEVENKNKDLEKVIDDYGNALYRSCFLMLKNKEDSEDILQEVFFKYMTRKKEFDSEEHKKAWLFKVCQNKCRNFLRFHKRHVCVAFEEVEHNIVSNDIESVEDKEEIEQIYNLSYKLQSVVILYYIEGYSIEEVSKILGISVSATKKRLQRAREELRILITEAKEELRYEY